MALSDLTRRVLRHGFADIAVADNVASVIDAGSGTIGLDARRHLHLLVKSVAVGNEIADAIDAGEALTGAQVNLLGIGLASRTAADEIKEALAEE